MKRWGDGVRLLLLVLGLTSCSSEAPSGASESTAAEATAAEATASASSAPAAKDDSALFKKAETVVRELEAGEVRKVRERFDAAMHRALPTDEKVQQLWQGSVQQFGEFQRIVSSQREPHDDYDIVVVLARFATSPMNVRVVFDREGALAGLAIQPSTDPAAWGPRPQTPSPPFDYDAEEVSYENPVDGITIGGTLTLPKGAGPHPAVLLITGSGPQDRDATMFGHKPFLVIADTLTRHGIAVLRVDDRGVGKTTGDFSKTTVVKHVTDAEAGVAFLSEHARVDKERIGLIGHSEGGMIAPMVAGRNDGVAYLVLLAGPSISGAELNPIQVGALLEAEGRDPKGIAKVVEGQKALMALLNRDAPEAEIRSAIQQLAIAGAELDPELDPNDEDVQKALAMQFSALLSPWFRSFAKTDPRTHLAKVKVPILLLYGTMDMQVPVEPNLAIAKTALAHNDSAEAKSLEGLNHLFQKAKTGTVAEYGQLEETFNGAALEAMTEWLVRTAKP